MMQLEQIVAKLREDYNVAGMSVALIKNGEIVSVEGYGVRDAAENLPMTKDTVMPIGSVTKTFTSLALAMHKGYGDADRFCHEDVHIACACHACGRGEA